MRNHLDPKLTRRRFIQLGSGMLGALAGSAVLPGALLKPESVSSGVQAAAPIRKGGPAPAQQDIPFDRHLVATDGWIYLPGEVAPYQPDDIGEDISGGLQNCYIFGFRDATHYDQTMLTDLKMHAQLAAPIMWTDEVPMDAPIEQGFTVKLTNLGLQVRPDLIDAHTVHFHGFRNALPIFDGEPHSSVGVPIIRNLTYFYRPHDPGTYKYHCHFEETEHVHMGMIGMVFVRPQFEKTYPGRKFAYNHLSTEFDREFVIVMNEVWAVAHWCDSHIQLPEWTDYKPEYFLMNGRVYPDTIKPNGFYDSNFDLATEAGNENLKYQPVSSLIKVNGGDRVLLRISNIGFLEQSLAITCGEMRVVGRDATLLLSKGGVDTSYSANVINCHTGETFDAIFEAPAHKGTAEFDRYLLYNTNPARITNPGSSGYGGQMTEIHVYPADTLAPQTEPNT